MPSPTVLGLIGIAAAATAFAQAPAPARFAEASVRPNTADDHIVTVDVGPGGRFAARGYTLVLLIQRAYGVMDWNVTGGPPWVRIDRFDVSAQADVAGKLTEAQLRPMLQALLAERFKLKLRRSSEEMFAYVLEPAAGGPKIKPSADSEEHPDTYRWSASGFRYQGIKMQDFARFVAGKLGVVGVDHTGLQGVYDVKVDWPVQSDRSAVFAAIETQLGLKFTPRRTPIQTLVIDSVEKVSKD